jgi:hypothetical protein
MDIFWSNVLLCSFCWPGGSCSYYFHFLKAGIIDMYTIHHTHIWDCQFGGIILFCMKIYWEFGVLSILNLSQQLLVVICNHWGLQTFPFPDPIKGWCSVSWETLPIKSFIIKVNYIDNPGPVRFFSSMVVPILLE